MIVALTVGRYSDASVLIDLQHHQRRDQPPVRPDVLAQQRQEHLVTVAHRRRRTAEPCRRATPRIAAKWQVKRRVGGWPQGLPLQCIAVTSTRCADSGARTGRGGLAGSDSGVGACSNSAQPVAASSHRRRRQRPGPTRPDVPAVRRHQRSDGDRADPGDRPGEHRARTPSAASGWPAAASSARTSPSPGIAAARSGANARPRNCPAPASRTSTSTATAASSPSATIPTLGDSLCEVGIQFQRRLHRMVGQLQPRSRSRRACDIAKELTRQSIANAK